MAQQAPQAQSLPTPPVSLRDLTTFVINLNRRPDRWTHIQSLLVSNGFRDIQRVPAVDGQTLSPEAVVQNTLPEARESLGRPRQRHEELGSLGAVGCYLSHVEVWRRVVAQRRPALVVEDDLWFTPQWDQYAAVRDPLTVCRGFDFVLLGYSRLRHPVMRSQANDAIIPYRGLFFGTMLYYITPEGAAKLLRGALPLAVQVDAYMGQRLLRGDVKAAIHVPSLWTHLGPDDTDIQTACVNCDRLPGDMGRHRADPDPIPFQGVLLVLLVLVVVGTLCLCTRHLTKGNRRGGPRMLLGADA